MTTVHSRPCKWEVSNNSLHHRWLGPTCNGRLIRLMWCYHLEQRHCLVVKFFCTRRGRQHSWNGTFLLQEYRLPFTINNLSLRRSGTNTENVMSQFNKTLKQADNLWTCQFGSYTHLFTQSVLTLQLSMWAIFTVLGSASVEWFNLLNYEPVRRA